MKEITSFFVYGTLMQGRLRSGLWPHPPKRIRTALVRASLFDLGPYPAAIEGPELLRGELWEFDLQHVPATVEILDRVEGYAPGRANNEYLRRSVSTIPIPWDQPVWAWMYLAPGPERLTGARKIEPYIPCDEMLPTDLGIDNQMMAQWPDPLARVPSSFSEE
jgi:gamma-glutamylcyclotransferase (GGCT)/AIG2-like uncharacterized protein YtfP